MRWSVSGQSSWRAAKALSDRVIWIDLRIEIDFFVIIGADIAVVGYANIFLEIGNLSRKVMTSHWRTVVLSPDPREDAG